MLVEFVQGSNRVVTCLTFLREEVRVNQVEILGALVAAGDAVSELHSVAVTEVEDQLERRLFCPAGKITVDELSGHVSLD